MAITFTTIMEFGPHTILVTDNGAPLCYTTPYQHEIIMHSFAVTTPYL